MVEISTPGATGAGTTIAKIIYILYLVGIFIALTGLVGMIMAYVNRSGAPRWLQSHYRFQIRTFWIGLLYLLVGAVLTGIGVGWLIILGWLIWLVVRCAEGLRYLDRGEAHPNPATCFSLSIMGKNSEDFHPAASALKCRDCSRKLAPSRLRDNFHPLFSPCG